MWDANEGKGEEREGMGDEGEGTELEGRGVEDVPGRDEGARVG